MTIAFKTVAPAVGQGGRGRLKLSEYDSHWSAIAGFAFCIIYPSMAIFKKVGMMLLATYVAGAFIALFLLSRWIFPRMVMYLKPVVAIIAGIILFVMLLLAHLYIHPQLDTAGFKLRGINFGASDADDAIDVAISELMHGRYPYYAKTFYDNPITPMPGTLLYALPFYALGCSALQNIFWLVVFYLLLCKYAADVRVATILVFSVVILSPNLVYHVMQGIDYLSNNIYVLAMLIMFTQTLRAGKPFWQPAIWAIGLGIALSSRLNYILLLPLVFFFVLYRKNLKAAFIYTTLIVLVFSGVTLPFFLYDPPNFSPLHTAGFLKTGEGEFPWHLILPAAGGGRAIVLGWRNRSAQLSTLLASCFLVESIVIVGGLVLVSVVKARLNLYYPHFGVLFMFFGIFAFGPRVFRSQSGTISPDSTRHMRTKKHHQEETLACIY